MAGGRGLRLSSGVEKPLIEVCGKPMIGYVIDALRGASKINRIIVAVSKYTPKTAEFAEKMGLEVLWTPAKGFCLDLRYAVEELKLGVTLVISADLPLITSSFIDDIVTYYEEKCRKPALTVMAPLEIYKKIGLSADFVTDINGRKLVPIGVNIVNGEKLREAEGYLEEEILVIAEERAIVNVNTPEDARIADSILRSLLRSKTTET